MITKHTITGRVGSAVPAFNTLKMTKDAPPFSSYEDFKDRGWTDEQMIDAGFAVYGSDTQEEREYDQKAILDAVIEKGVNKKANELLNTTIDEVLSNALPSDLFTRDELLTYVREHYTIDDVYGEDTLHAWAKHDGYVQEDGDETNSV